MRHLNLDHLLTLKTVVAAGGFTAAARQLHLSQSAVSVQVRELETRLGVVLLDRLGKTAAPTSAGRELLAHAESLLGQADATLAAMRRLRDGRLGEIRIGASTTAMIYHLPPVLAALKRAHPDLDIHLTAGTTTTIAERLAANAIDVGVVSLPIDARGMSVTSLFVEPLVAIFPRDTTHLPDVATPEEMRLHPLLLESGRAHVKLTVLEWLATGEAAPRPAMELDNVEVIARMVVAGIGASIVPVSAVEGRGQRGEVLVRPLAPPLTRELAMVLRSDRPETRALAVTKAAIATLQSAPITSPDNSGRRRLRARST